ncbi:MAG TPA: MGMT family protein [Pyrinomonadaceae bacterium]|jgi:methylated-DNA-protein-cysteine methyltransferase-like protein
MASSNKPDGAKKKASLTSPPQTPLTNPSAAITSAASHPPAHVNVDAPDYRERVYEIVRRIPTGRVMTYGQIAELLGEGYTARTVGFVMHAADEHDPWHRVINSQGACSTGRVLLPSNKQQRMLEAEGIAFDARGRCDLGRYRWSPDETEDANASKQDDPQPSLFND